MPKMGFVLGIRLDGSWKGIMRIIIPFMPFSQGIVRMIEEPSSEQ